MPKSKGRYVDFGLLEAAMIGLMDQRDRINDRIEIIRLELGSGSSRYRATGKVGLLSPAAERHVMDSIYGSPRDPRTGSVIKYRRSTISPAARKRIAEATRKRWAAFRKAKAKGKRNAK